MTINFLKRFLFVPIVAIFLVSCAPYTSDYFTSISSSPVKSGDRLYKNVSVTSFLGIKEKTPPSLGFIGDMDPSTLPAAASNGLRDSLDIAGMLATDGDARVTVTGRVKKVEKDTSWSTVKVSVTSDFNIDYFGDLHDFRAVKHAELPGAQGNPGLAFGEATALGFESLIVFLKSLSSQ